MSWFFVIAAIIALLGGGEIKFLGQNLALILATPFFFLGLGVIHLLMRRFPAPLMALSAFYIFIMVLGWPMLAVAALGFFEQWAGIRLKYGGLANDVKEEE